MNAPSLPRTAPNPFPCLVAGVLTAALLPLAMADMPRSIAYGGGTQAVLTALACSFWFWVAVRPEAAAEWWAGVRASERVSKVGRYAAVYHGPILVALFYVMWCAGRLALGHWPKAWPIYDPKGIPATAVVYLLIYGWAWCGGAAFLWNGYRAAAALSRKDGTAMDRVGDFGFMLCLWGATIAYFYTDPHELLKWFLD